MHAFVHGEAPGKNYREEWSWLTAKLVRVLAPIKLQLGF